jgi:toxin ParE1/3/4
MATCRLTRRARQDVLRIWRRIAHDNQSAADRFVDLLTHHFRVLGDFPEAGRRPDQLRSGYRSFPVGEYSILYRIKDAWRPDYAHRAFQARFGNIIRPVTLPAGQATAQVLRAAGVAVRLNPDVVFCGFEPCSLLIREKLPARYVPASAQH